MKKVLVTIPAGEVLDSFFPPDVRARLAEFADVCYNPCGRQYTAEELAAALRGVDAVMTGWGTPAFDRRVLAGADRLKLIAHTGGTVADLAGGEVFDRGIRVFSGNKLFAESVAEGTLAYILMAQRRIPAYMERVKQGVWRTEGDVWEGLLDQTVGIVGLGDISLSLIPMLRPFRVKIKICSGHEIPPGLIADFGCRRASLEEIFSTCDIVTVHSALNAANRGLIRAEHFRLLRDGALFVNTSRGDVVDEAAMIEALRGGRFRAVLDVFHTEPLPDESELRSMPWVSVVPHMAGPTSDRRPMIARALIETIRRCFDGEEDLPLEIDRARAARMTRSS